MRDCSQANLSGWGVLDKFAASARHFLASLLENIVMQMRKINSEKGHWVSPEKKKNWSLWPTTKQGQMRTRELISSPSKYLRLTRRAGKYEHQSEDCMGREFFQANRSLCVVMQNQGKYELLLLQHDKYRGYYTVARRYEFYVPVARTISHEWVIVLATRPNIKFIYSS